MGAQPSPIVWEVGEKLMKKIDNTAATISGVPRLPPVRVKLQRINAEMAKPHPPDGDGKIWWRRLQKALGTCSSAFVNASLFQLQQAARLPCSGISEIALNAALAMIESAHPMDEIEGALAIQMACTHSAAMAVLARLGSEHGSGQRLAVLASAAARLSRTYATQVEALRRLRSGGQQCMRVEHVHVNEGGQAVIGNVKKCQNPTFDQIESPSG
jgi:hypothetical protein